MADLRIIYPVDNYIGAMIAEVAQTLNAAKQKTDQALAILNCIGTDEEVETAMGMAPGLLYGYHLKGLLTTQKASLDSLASDIVKIDKGL